MTRIITYLTITFFFIFMLSSCADNALIEPLSNPSISTDVDAVEQCTPGYEPCLKPASDYDCAGGTGDGPNYASNVKVYGEDIYGLDRDGDGFACF
jgi:hypothetical protein